MRILFYSQHVLGIGHFFRSMEIARALKPHEVLFIEGGEPLVDFTPPPHVRRALLPPIMMDPSFSRIEVRDEDVKDIWTSRTDLLLHLYEEFRPHWIVTELFPFGRRVFRKELMPLLEAARKGGSKTRVACSLRDILVEKQDVEKYEARVLEILNRWYDLLLVHTDPRVIELGETFSRMKEISVPVVYTGFVCRTAPPRRAGGGRRVIVASTGGGRVGADLLQTVVRGFKRMARRDLELRVFLGPFMEESDRTALFNLATGDSRISLHPFASDFLAELAGADLSISMAGYNTCMDILASQVPALVYPFAQNREQAMRAERLERLGLLRILRTLSETDLTVAAEQLLTHSPVPAPHSLELEGAAKTAAVLAAFEQAVD
jgi:predicted glycosyltransferase